MRTIIAFCLATAIAAVEGRYRPTAHAVPVCDAILIDTKDGIWTLTMPHSVTPVGCDLRLPLAAGCFYASADLDRLRRHLTPDCDSNPPPADMTSIAVVYVRLMIEPRDPLPEDFSIPVTVTIRDVQLEDGTQIGDLGTYQTRIGLSPPG